MSEESPTYANGEAVPDSIDSTTRAWSDGLDPVKGAKMPQEEE